MKSKNSKTMLALRIIVAAAIVACLAILTLALASCKKKPGGDTTTSTPPAQTTPSFSSEGYMSPTGVALSGDGIYVSDATAKTVTKFAADGTLTAIYNAGASVNCITSSGGRLYAGLGGSGGRIVILSESLEPLGETKVGHTPSDILVNGERAYVANRFSCTVSVIDTKKCESIAEISVSREPMALAKVGDMIFVACHLPDDAADADTVSASISVIDTKTNALAKNIELVNGAGNVKDIVASPKGSKLYLSHTVARYQYPTTQLDAGWVNTNAVSIIDVATQSVDYTFLLDDIEQGAAVPWGLAISDDGSVLYCAISGTDELMKIELSKLDTLVSRFGKKTNKLPISSKDEIVNYIPFAKDAKTRLSLDGKGARAVTLSGGKLYVAEYFSGDVKLVDTESFSVVGTLAAAAQPDADSARQGEIYWNDATICYQNWQSCASCHPEARSGGFNWDELGDGIGTMKQTKSMIYVMRTPPCLATGLESSGEHGVSGSVSGTPLWNNSEDAEVISAAMIAYLRSIVPESSPYLNEDGTLTASATHGGELFESLGCAVCHPAPLYTDLKLHDSPTLEFDDSWEYRQMDTPSLVEVWRSFPWSYIGHFTDMKDAVTYYAENYAGKTISAADAADLAEFVLSIGADGESIGVEQIVLDGGDYNKVISGQKIVSVSLVGQSDNVKSSTEMTVTLALLDKSGGVLKKLELKTAIPGRGERTVITLDSPLEIVDDVYAISVDIGDHGSALKITR